jgi:hypothetical protein
MFAYMKQHLSEVDHDAKLRFKVACIGFFGLCVAVATAVITVVRT